MNFPRTGCATNWWTGPLPEPSPWRSSPAGGDETGCQQAERVRLHAELPALAVEVISSGAANRAPDEVDKFAVYERAGLPSYWLVDPAVPSVRGYQHDGTNLVLVVEASGREEGVFERPFPVRFRPADLLGPART